MTLENRILKIIKERAVNDWHKPQYGIYHASQIYDICTGKLKPKNFFKEQKFNDITLMTFEIGTMYHNYIQKFFEEEEREVKIKIEEKDFKIIGRVDLLLDGNIPIELKTCSSFPKKAQPAHIYQLQCYLKALERKKLEAKYGFLTYIEKHNRVFRTMNFKIKQNESLYEEIILKVASFHEELKKVDNKEK